MSKNYNGLSTVSFIFKAIAYLNFIGGAIALIYQISESPYVDGVILGLAQGAIGLISGTIFLAISEGISILIDIAQDLSKIERNTRKD